MPTPTLIPARNEADNIGRILARLPRDVEPIVLVNGCTDNTAEIAENFGATVIGQLEAGKMPALQAGMSYLGERALEPFITLDADSFPLSPRHWHRRMLQGLGKTGVKPAVVIGPTLFKGGPGIVANSVRSVHQFGRQLAYRHDNHRGYFAGRNMLVYPRCQYVLKALLDLDNFWPGEDYAIKDVVVDNGGKTYKTSNSLATVVTDAVRNPTMRQKLFQDKAVLAARLRQSYSDDQPPGAKRYFRQTPSK